MLWRGPIRLKTTSISLSPRVTNIISHRTYTRRVYTDERNFSAELQQSLRKHTLGETKKEEQRRLAQSLQHIFLPEVKGQDAYVGKYDEIADIRLGSSGDLSADSPDDIFIPPPRIPALPLLPKSRTASENNVFIAVGRRKSATAVAALAISPTEALADIYVNRKELIEYFKDYRGRDLVLDPLLITELLGLFKVNVSVSGGGLMAQAGAARLAISRALQSYQPDLRYILRYTGMLRRDPRMTERKKPGKAKARKSYTWHKR